MKIMVTEACFGRYLTIDGINFDDMEQHIQDEITDQIITHVRTNTHDKREFLIHLLYHIECDNTDMDEEPCDQCGSYFTEDTYILGEEPT